MGILFPAIYSIVRVHSGHMRGVSLVFLPYALSQKRPDRFILIPCLFHPNDRCGVGWEKAR